MNSSIVLDTNIISYAAGGHGDEEQAVACSQIVFTLIDSNEYCLALDTDGHILDEYKSNLDDYTNPHTRLIQQFLERQLRNQDGISFYIPIHESEIEELAEQGFHEDDIMFVRVAPRTDTELITSCDGESFLDNEHREWIEEELGVSVYSAIELRSETDIL